MSSTVIKVEDLSKQYRLGNVGTGTISHDLNRFYHKVRGKQDPYLKIGEENDRTAKGISQYVWALKDINFEVKQGEVLGIIGRNGAGKSTLLKILSRTTTPTTGSVKIKGRIASLLEVGTGFHPELTGRENIFLNGAILGMTKQEIKTKFDEIVDFAGVERYIDTPVKRYSSGMYVRLAFGVAAYLESEILIVDEVLAVGDVEFQDKCFRKMDKISKGEGRTVLFVSHNMTAIKTLCPSAIFMEKGKISYIGNIEKAVSFYYNLEEAAKVNGDIPTAFIRHNTGQAKVISFSLLNEKEEITNKILYDEIIHLKLSIQVYQKIADAILDVKLLSEDGTALSYSANTDNQTKAMPLETGTHLFEVKIDNCLNPGSYKFTVGIHNSKGTTIDILENICEFSVLKFGRIRDHNFDWIHGHIALASTWNKIN